MLERLKRLFHGKYFYISGLLLCLFLIALFTGGPFTYSLFYIYLFTLLISAVWCVTAYKGISCRLKNEKNCIVVGEEITLTLTVKNMYPIFFPYVVVQEEFLGLKWESSLHPLEKKMVTSKFAADRYGVYPVGNIKIEVKDGFDIFAYSRNVEQLIKIKVYPKLISLENLYFRAYQPFGKIAVNDRIYEDYTSINDIRRYTYGDSLKKIHWKTSAKKAELYVKRFDQLADNDVSIFFDRYKNHYMDKVIDEKAMECCASLVKYCMDLNIGVRVITSRSTIEAKNSYQFTEIMDQLILLEPDEDIKVSDIIRNRKDVSYTGNSIMIITPNLDRELVNRIMLLRGKSFGVMIFLICWSGDVSKNSEIIDFLSRNGVKVSTLYVED